MCLVSVDFRLLEVMGSWVPPPHFSPVSEVHSGPDCPLSMSTDAGRHCVISSGDESVVGSVGEGRGSGHAIGLHSAPHPDLSRSGSAAVISTYPLGG